MDDQQHASKRVGVIVVHGVGEAELGYSVNTLAYALQDHVPGWKVVPHSEIIRLQEEERRARSLEDKNEKPASELFRVVRRRAKHPSGADVVMEELYWADLTNLGPGRINSLKGMFQLIFESHHFVDAMLDRARGWGTGLLRTLLLIASWLMRGPIAALTISASLVCALLLYAPTPETSNIISKVIEPTAYVKFNIAQLTLIALSLYGILRVFYIRSLSWYDLLFWLGIVAFIMLVVTSAPDPIGTRSLLSDYLPKDDRLTSCFENWRDACFVNVPYVIIILGWHLWGILIVSAVILGAILAWRARERGEAQALASIGASLGVIVLQFMLWTIIVVTVMFPMLNRGELVTGLTHALPNSTQETGDALREQLTCATTGPQSPLHPVCDIMEPRRFDFEWIPPFKFVYALTALGFIFALLIMLGVLVRRAMIARRFKGTGASAAAASVKPDQLPRLVFSPWLLIYLVAAVLFLIGVIYWIKPAMAYIGDYRVYFLTAAAVAAIVLPMLAGHRTSNVIHIARDLIDHHYAPRLETAYYFFPKAFRPYADRPRRRRIQARLQCMLKALVEGEPYSAIVFVAHSQGTVVVFDYLSREEPPSELGSASVGFVTFGSPIGNLYERYFHEYKVETGKVERVEKRVAGWTNLTRVDDYIGGLIAHGRTTGIDNRVLDPGGHTDYWPLPEVLKSIDQMIWRTLDHATAHNRAPRVATPTAPLSGT